jgi:hypothetical protein
MTRQHDFRFAEEADVAVVLVGTTNVAVGKSAESRHRYGPLAEVAHPSVRRGRAVAGDGGASFGRSAGRLELTHNWPGNRFFEASCTLGGKTTGRRL